MRKYYPVAVLLCLWLIATAFVNLRLTPVVISEQTNGYRLLGRLIAKALW
jgi:hypothetical protein